MHGGGGLLGTRGLISYMCRLVHVILRAWGIWEKSLLNISCKESILQ